MKNLLKNQYGLGLDIKESPKTEAEREEILFVDTMETLEHIWHSEHELHEEYGIDLLGFSQYYYHAIENLVIAKYGYDTADVIWWWVSFRSIGPFTGPFIGPLVHSFIHLSIHSSILVQSET